MECWEVLRRTTCVKLCARTLAGRGLEVPEAMESYPDDAMKPLLDAVSP